MDELARDTRFFGEISLRINSFGCAFGGWDFLRSGRFQTDVPEGLERKMLTSKGMGSILQ